MKVCFDRFTLDTASRQMTDGARALHLSPKAFDLLTLLVERRPHAVSKNDLFARLWPDTHVSAGSLAVVIAEIRGVLGDQARTPRFVRTLPRFGYAFCGMAREVSSRRDVSPSPWLQLVCDTEQWVLTKPRSIVGRSASVDIVLRAADVSRRHAAVTADGHGVVVEDLGSKNGTYVDGKRIERPVRLRVDQVVHVGSVELRLRCLSGEEATRTARVRETNVSATASAAIGPRETG